ncbi:PREDICTED: ZEAMMB73_Zm00001d045353 [Prunus dulcis]|uniref:PREDICTED: ZEAMMB73_Zm00001d045353 n=2 Tax=Prunus dulcis TaxID=3755 RepID=A0A5E4E5U7_PRUDU|nr:PREDICTED: ZEAMMB73_Zm00001d045353 [Prunus dulcis]
MLQFGANPHDRRFWPQSQSPSPQFTMTTLPEITDLFARLASRLKSLNDTSFSPHTAKEELDEAALDLSISKLNHSLNPNGNSTVRVLDTVLSLMCFKAPQVFDSGIEYLVKTIVTVLLSSIRCKVLRSPKDEILLIGSSISHRDCGHLIEAAADILEKLEGHGKLSDSLLCAIVRVVSSASLYRQLSRPVFDVKSVDAKKTLTSKLLCYFPREKSLDNNKIPFRLLLWYLDPLILKRDVSNILQETIDRPFLCLSKEFRESNDWLSVITSLVLSPIMFVEARALLHRWFLVTGLSSVLELLIQLVAVVLDVVSRPMFWDISLEVGAKLQFSNAYFPYNQRLLRILTGPLSYEGLLQLVHETNEPVPCAQQQLCPTFKPPAVKVSTIDDKSLWSLAINFPDWFYFASALLFSEKTSHDSCHPECILGASKVGKAHHEELPSISAARYIAWILSPVSKSHQDSLADCLIKTSESWAFKQFGSGSHEKETYGYKKKLKKQKFCEEDYSSTTEYDYQAVAVWLSRFNTMYTRNCNETVNRSTSRETKRPCGHSLQQNVLFRRIPLGILLGCPHYTTEDGCESLMHYATTSRIFQLRETNANGLKHVKWNSKGHRNLVTWSDECNEREATAGACLVFSLTDIIESMSASLFETEEAGVDFLCRVKMRISKYLIKCIKRLIQLKIDDRNWVVMDFCHKLEKWRHQGQEVLELHKDLDDVIHVLSQRTCSVSSM